MRHQKKRHKLGRTAAHRKATLAAMASALIEHKRIETTLAKAKALRSYVEPLITRAKDDTTHNRREVFSHLQSKEAVTELFGDVAAQVGDRPGGYTRVIKLGQRLGDSAEMAVVELVDWNDVKPEGATTGRKKTRRAGRSRRGGGAKTAQPQARKPKAEKPAQRQAEPAEEPQQPIPAPTDEVTAAPEPVAQGESDKLHNAPKAPVNPDQNDHPDTPQGASPGKGEPHPQAGEGDQGAAGGSQHRG